MRYLLDTNIVIFLFTENTDDICRDVEEIINDYQSVLYVSSLSLVEIKHLFEKGKIKTKFKTTEEIFKYISEILNLRLLHTKDEHLKTYGGLNIIEEKTDLIDRFIISQAITEKIFLVSSDRAFENYTSQKLKFIFNKR